MATDPEPGRGNPRIRCANPQTGRWKSSSLGYLSPEDFLALPEDSLPLVVAAPPESDFSDLPAFLSTLVSDAVPPSPVEPLDDDPLAPLPDGRLSVR